MNDTVFAIAFAAVLLFFIVYVCWPKLRSWATGRPTEPPKPERKIPENVNQSIVVAEYLAGKPNLGRIFNLPVHDAPVTPFQDFNQRLLIVKPGLSSAWPDKRLANDYPATVKGDLAWVRRELKLRLRPIYPTILDSLGWWAEASRQLEMNPYARSPVIEAYLAIPVDRRPVVISRPRSNDDKEPGKLEFFRYYFDDYELVPHFLNGHPAKLLQAAMLAFTDPGPNGWIMFSPARLRKQVLDEVTELQAEARQEAEFAEQIRQATSRNRFAALWAIPDSSTQAAEAET